MKNFKLLLAYDGGRYRGWQRLGNSDMTIQGKIEAVLGRLFEHPVEIAGSGRTDAGVHARGQTANFKADTEKTAAEVEDYLRHYLPEDIGVLSVEEVPLSFHSRLSVRDKTYCYRVWNCPVPNVFERRYLTVIPEPLRVEAMAEAAQAVVGRHNFLAFCSNKQFKKSPVRTVSSFQVERIGGEIRFTVTADGFLYNMVRILVGTLLEIGRGERTAETLSALLDGAARELAGPTAPAKGLCLMEVRY